MVNQILFRTKRLYAFGVGYKPTEKNWYLHATTLALLGSLCSVAAAYRWFGIGRDYLIYFYVYNNISGLGQLGAFHQEIGFLLTLWFCKTYLFLSINQVYLLLIVIALFLKFRLIMKYTSAPILASIVYIAFLYPTHEYTQLRVALALGVAYTALDCYFEKKYLLSVGLFIIAALFHASTLALAVGVGVVVTIEKLPPKQAAILLFTLMLVLIFAVSRLSYLADIFHLMSGLNARADVYAQTNYTYEAPTITSSSSILLIIIVGISPGFLKCIKEERMKTLYLLSCFSILLYVLFLSVPVVAFRLRDLFVFPLLIYPFCFDRSPQSRIPATFVALLGVGMLYKSIIFQVITV